nr:PSD1 and planctomycete cytochrome C domain-containing protein [Cellulophaga sp. F20128]
MLVLQSSCSSSGEYTEPLPEIVDFNFHIRPILVQNCYLCHGPDPSSRKANLRLDNLEGATALLEDGGYAIVPKKSSKGLLIRRINHTAEDQIMPPPESNLKLTPRDKALLEKWIDQGAQWKDHWAFIQPTTTANANDNNVIDAFIDKRIEEKGIEKMPTADKNTLIRRVSYLLTGLPPSPTAVENFIANKSDLAYEQLVDSYLNTPAYGERWARHWMDLTRYAETKGHEFDYTITGAWKYRDYLIRAFNDDIAYDQLLKEHLAGDLLENPRYGKEDGILESPLGTAFFAMGEGTHSPVDIRQDEADRIDNIIDVTTKTFQGLTVSCAKCHDHKFDPITAADYYAFYGVIESTRFSPIPAELSKDKKQTVQEIEGLQTYMRQMLADSWSDKAKSIQAQHSIKDKQVPSKDTPNYKVIGDFRNSDFNGWKSNGLGFGNGTTLGNPILDKNTEKLIRLDEGRASSKAMGLSIFGALRSPNFVIDTDFIGIRALGVKSTIRIVVDNFQLIQNPIYGNLTRGINTPEWNNHTFNVASLKGHKAYIEILPGGYNRHDYSLPEDAFIEAEYAIAYDEEWPKTIGNDREPNAIGVSSQLVKTVNKQLKKGQLPSQFPALKVMIDSSERLAKKLKSNSFFYGVYDGFAINSPIFNRGSYKELSEDSIPRRFLSALPLGDIPYSAAGSGRLEMANAMLNKDNPLTSRVMVNRIWHHLFGKGIVETVDNFGLQGKLPTHPELLDFLAINFQEEGWSIKKMIRQIVVSEAFQRSTIRSEELAEKDPTNIYLASFPVRRLESEAIRDALLSVSGNLDTTLYGKPIATHLTDFMQGRGRPATSGPLDGGGRRSIYQEVRRNFLEPMMTTFDRPMPFSTFGKRNVTNVPSQSLIIMNDPFVAKQAELMAQQLLAAANLSFENKVNWVYMKTFSRSATADEITKAKTFITMLQNRKEQELPKGLDKETSIWTTYCHSIFNLKEFIYLI